MSQPPGWNSYICFENCNQWPQFTLNTFTGSQTSWDGEIITTKAEMETQRHHRVVSECHRGQEGKPDPTLTSILNVIILSPWCQWIQGIPSDWGTVSALQVCQERQELVGWSCALCQRDTSSSLPKLFAVVSVMPTDNSWQAPTYSKILMTCGIMAWEMMLKIKAWKLFADSTMPAYLSFSTWSGLSLIYIWNMRGFSPQLLMSQGYACVHKPYVKERSSVFQVWEGNCSAVRHRSSLCLCSQTW